jgi:hypothetical protein
MTEAEIRILRNQVEIMWVLSLLLGKLCPDLVGRNGELDGMRADLAHACKTTNAFIEKSPHA